MVKLGSPKPGRVSSKQIRAPSPFNKNPKSNLKNTVDKLALMRKRTLQIKRNASFEETFTELANQISIGVENVEQVTTVGQLKKLIGQGLKDMLQKNKQRKMPQRSNQLQIRIKPLTDLAMTSLGQNKRGSQSNRVRQLSQSSKVASPKDKRTKDQIDEEINDSKDISNTTNSLSSDSDSPVIDCKESSNSQVQQASISHVTALINSKFQKLWQELNSKFACKDQLEEMQQLQLTMSANTSLVQTMLQEQKEKMDSMSDKLNPFYDEFKWYQEKQHKEVTGLRQHLLNEMLALNLKVQDQQEQNERMNGKVEKMSVDDKVQRVRQYCADLIDQTNQQNFAVRNEWNQSLQKLITSNLNQEKKNEYQSSTNNDIYTKLKILEAGLVGKLNRFEITDFENLVKTLPSRTEFQTQVKVYEEQVRITDDKFDQINVKLGEFQSLLQRYDELFLLKAQKHSLDELELTVRQLIATTTQDHTSHSNLILTYQDNLKVLKERQEYIIKLTHDSRDKLRSFEKVQECQRNIESQFAHVALEVKKINIQGVWSTIHACRSQIEKLDAQFENLLVVLNESVALHNISPYEGQQTKNNRVVSVVNQVKTIINSRGSSRNISRKISLTGLLEEQPCLENTQLKAFPSRAQSGRKKGKTLVIRQGETMLQVPIRTIETARTGTTSLQRRKMSTAKHLSVQCPKTPDIQPKDELQKLNY